MADTWTALASNVAPANNKYMIGIFNGASSGRVIRIYKIYILNKHIAAVTGVAVNFQIRLISALTIGTGTTLTPVAHDSSNTSLPAQLLVATAAETVSDSSILRSLIWSNDEAAVGTASQDELEMITPYSLVWESGSMSANSIPQALTLREGQGLVVKCVTNTTVGTGDYRIIFTNSAT